MLSRVINRDLKKHSLKALGKFYGIDTGEADEEDEETVNETGVTGKVIEEEIGSAFKSIKVDGEEVLNIERQEYYDDSEIEELCRIYEEENVEKMLEIDLQEQLNSVDSVEWCRDWMGDEEFCRIVEDNGLIDFDEFVEYLKDCDGYEILSNYDGNVYELSDDEYYYIYRVY